MGFFMCRILEFRTRVATPTLCYNISMATGSSEKRRINVRLVHNGVQPGTPVDDPLRFGLQDSKGEVHPGVLKAKGVQHFEFSLDVKESADPSLPAFGGAFVMAPLLVAFSI
jgi:hypothetical protein